MKKSLIIICIGIILYGFSLFNGFVWDDEDFLMKNPIIAQSTHSASTQTYFRPVINAVIRVIYTLFGSHPFMYHFASVAMHIATAVLLLYLFKRFFSENRAFILSLMFLVHPTAVEAVCFASALQEVWFTFTGVLGLYILVRSKNISVITILIAITLLITALLMKETALLFFVIVFFYLLLFHRKNSDVFPIYFAFVIIALFTYVFVRFSLGNTYWQGEGLFPIMRVSFATRLLNIPAIIMYYLGMFIFPFKLGIAQHWVVHTPGLFTFFLPLVAEIALSIAAVIYIVKTKNKLFTFFFLWFILGLLPHLQIVPLNMTVAERWLYFPMVGLLGMGGAILNKFKMLNLKFNIAALLIISLFFIRSFGRILDWRNGLALFSSNISPSSNFDLQNNMGVELFRVGKYNEAKRYFEISTRMAPYWWVNWNNLGAAYGREQNYAKAEECYKKSIHNGDYNLAYENMAKSLLRRDKGKAREFASKALQLFPESEILQVVLRDSLK